jgi:hypothetical protein
VTKLSRRFVAAIASTLEPHVREAVLGDLTELRVSLARTIYELLGLILKQEAQLWRTWRPWLALFGNVGAIGWLLSNVCLGVASDVARHALIYWQYGVRYNSGLTGAQEIEVVVCTSFAVVCWSWIAGFTLSKLSGRTALINRSLFCLAWFCLCGPLGLLLYFARLVLNALDLVVLPHAPGFSALVFFAAFPLSLATLLFLIPALLGMRRAQRGSNIARPYALLLSASVAAATGLLIWMQGWQRAALEKWSEGKWSPGGPSWPERLVPLLVLSWPVVYLLATQRQHANEKPVVGSLS